MNDKDLLLIIYSFYLHFTTLHYLCVGKSRTINIHSARCVVSHGGTARPHHQDKLSVIRPVSGDKEGNMREHVHKILLFCK